MTQSKEAKVLYYASQAAMMNGPDRGILSLQLFCFLYGTIFRVAVTQLIGNLQFAQNRSEFQEALRRRE